MSIMTNGNISLLIFGLLVCLASTSPPASFDPFPPPLDPDPVVQFVGRTLDTLLNIVKATGAQEETSIDPQDDLGYRLSPLVNGTVVSGINDQDEAVDDGEGASGMPNPDVSFEGISFETGTRSVPPDTVGMSALITTCKWSTLPLQSTTNPAHLLFRQCGLASSLEMTQTVAMVGLIQLYSMTNLRIGGF